MRPNVGIETMRELPDPYILAFLLALALVLLLSYNRLVTAVRGAAACVRGLHSTCEMLGNNYVFGSVRYAFLLLLPFYAMTLVVTGLSTRPYLRTLLTLLVLVLFLKAVCLAMGWLTSRRPVFRQLEWTGSAFCVLAMVLSLPAALAGWLIPAAPQWLLWGWLALAAAAAGFLYARRGFSIIFPAGFSVFFWVLYLCTLEVLPICVVVNILINGN